MVKQKRPSPILYFFASIYFRIYTKNQHNLKITGVKPKGPALVLSNHTSNEDYKFVVSACFPNRVSFLATNHWFTFKKLAFWLKAIGAIPKYQFATDLESMKKVKYIIEHKKGIVYIAPEGTIYANGKLGYISPAIAKMVRFLKVPVYACKIEGAGLGNAKWSKNKHKDYVSIDTKMIVEKDEIPNLSIDEIYKRIVASLQYNEFEYQQKNNIKIEGNDLAEGFETMFYTCPSCKSEFTLTTHGNTIECSHCHAKATIDNNFRFIWQGNEKYYDNYIEWYDEQYKIMKELVKSPDFKIEDDVEYGIDQPGVDNYIKVGKGHLTFSHNGWDYTGTFKDENITEHDEVSSVFLATLKVGVHFELPRKNGHNRVYYPTNGLTSMKWHLASRAMSELLAEK